MPVFRLPTLMSWVAAETAVAKPRPLRKPIAERMSKGRRGIVVRVESQLITKMR